MFTELALPQCNGRLRRIQDSDLNDLVLHSNNANVSRWLVDSFPYPCTEADGREFLKRLQTDQAEHVFAIEIDGGFAGEIGFRPGRHERRFVLGFGYWLAEPYWGRGIMSEVVRVSTDLLLNERRFVRVETDVYEPNVASQRVLANAGFVLESRRRKAVIKQGKIYDCLHFAKVRD